MAGAAGRKKLVGRYEVGRTIGQGTFAKVKFAVDADTGAAVAMKVLDKETIFTHRMLHQIKKEISIMKIVRHPNIVGLNEVLAGKTKIYIILELVTGGVPEGVTLLEFEGANQEEEPEVQETDEAVAAEELPECPDHQPSSFLKDDLLYQGFCKYCLHPAGDED
ncbi:CBL-interacting protein kinase 24-like isoform X5 [Miscanthus floridulus]|uniref:CBL-interacting protein kinase 24-like isoform X5 n=1 Tax=Miscanthus floridulus TaxID=154761 RepID=UPI003459B997